MAMTWTGDWSNQNAYETDDVVYYNGSSYIAIQNIAANGNPPDENIAEWALVAEQGLQGIQGPGPINWLGTWDAETTYAVNSGILYQVNGNSYVAVQECTAGLTPPENATYWQLLNQAVGINWMGNWNEANAYQTNDVVSYTDGCAYIAITSVPANSSPPDSNTDQWNMMVQGIPIVTNPEEPSPWNGVAITGLALGIISAIAAVGSAYGAVAAVSGTAISAALEEGGEIASAIENAITDGVKQGGTIYTAIDGMLNPPVPEPEKLTNKGKNLASPAGGIIYNSIIQQISLNQTTALASNGAISNAINQTIATALSQTGVITNAINQAVATGTQGMGNAIYQTQQAQISELKKEISKLKNMLLYQTLK